MKYLFTFLLMAGVVAGQDLNVRPGSTIKLWDADGSHYLGIKAPPVVTSNVTWSFPTTDGTAGQSLLTDGSGNWYWGSAVAGAIADGDKGDITVSGGGLTWSIDDGVQIDSLATADAAYGAGWNGSLLVPTRNALYDKIETLADPNTSVPWFDNIRQTFNPGVLQAGINVGAVTGDPSSPIDGDLWYDSTANELTARINGANVALGAGGGSSSLTATYVGYGDGSNALTGEAGFTYNAGTNTLTVPNLSNTTGNIDSVYAGDFYILDSFDDDYLRIDVANDLSAARTLSLTVPDAATALTIPGSLTMAGVDVANAWADGVKQTFNPGAVNSGINVGSIAGDPSTPANGDLWYDSVANELTARINGANVSLANPALTATQVGYGSGAGVLTSEAAFTYDAATNTLTAGAVTAGNVTASTVLNIGSDFQIDGSLADNLIITNDNIGDDIAIDMDTENVVRLWSGTGVVDVIFDSINVTVPTEAYDATDWNGDNTVPTKDAVRDKFESIGYATGSFTGTDTYVASNPGTIFNGNLTGNATITLTISAGQSAEFRLVSDGTHTLTIPTSRRNGYSSTTTSISMTAGNHTVAFRQTATDLWVGDTIEELLDLTSDVTGTLPATNIDADVRTGTFGITINGAGSAITTGIKGDVSIPYNCTITNVTVLADTTGSLVVDLWKDTYANFPPTDADSITAAAPPTISASDKSTDSTLTGWGTGKDITAGDTIRFNVDSAATITRATIIVTVTKN